MGFSLFLRRHRHIVPVLALHDRFDIVGKGKLHILKRQFPHRKHPGLVHHVPEGVGVRKKRHPLRLFPLIFPAGRLAVGAEKRRADMEEPDGFMHQAADRPNNPGHPAGLGKIRPFHAGKH